MLLLSSQRHLFSPLPTRILSSFGGDLPHYASPSLCFPSSSLRFSLVLFFSHCFISFNISVFSNSIINSTIDKRCQSVQSPSIQSTHADIQHSTYDFPLSLLFSSVYIRVTSTTHLFATLLLPHVLCWLIPTTVNAVVVIRYDAFPSLFHLPSPPLSLHCSYFTFNVRPFISVSSYAVCCLSSSVSCLSSPLSFSLPLSCSSRSSLLSHIFFSLIRLHDLRISCI